MTVKPTQVAPVPRVAPRRVLVIDDDPLVLRALELTLQSDGHHVTLACGGEAGLAAFHHARATGQMFAVVMTDLNMPNVGGREVARVIKETEPSVALVLMTGSADPLAVERESAGMIDMLLSKPPTRTELRTAFRALEHRREPQVLEG